MNTANHIHSDLTEKLIGYFYKVYNKLGYGFKEKIYERAFIIELEREGLNFTSQKTFKVFYDGIEVGKHIPDLLVEDTILIEHKAAIAIVPSHEDQLKNSLRATDLEVGLLFNYGVTPQFKRKVFSNEFKKHPILNKSKS